MMNRANQNWPEDQTIEFELCSTEFIECELPEDSIYAEYWNNPLFNMPEVA